MVGWREGYHHMWSPTELTIQHREIIRLAVTGQKTGAIARQTGFSVFAIKAILRSELAQAEIARLSDLADQSVTNVPLRVRMMSELHNAAKDAIKVNHALLLSDQTDPRVRSRVGMHFIDRVIYDKNDDTNEGSYREILRKLDEIEKKNVPGALLLPPGSVTPVSEVPPLGAVVAEAESA